MMSTEFPEILPEPFSNPCASYNGNAENFMDEVCRNSLYNNTGYYSDSGSCSFDADSSHHSLILEDPALGHNQEALNANGRTSYSNYQVGIKLIVSEGFPVDAGCQMNDVTRTEEKDLHDSLGSVQVTVECADDKESNALSRTMKLNQDLLRPRLHRQSPVSSTSSESYSYGSPTPTPSYRDLVSSPAVEYPGAEEKAFDVRGVEVAQLEEDGDIGTDDLTAGDGSGYQALEELEESRNEHVQEPRPPDSASVEVKRDLADSHIRSNHEVLPSMPKRRSHLSHLRLIQPLQCTLPLPTAELRKLSDPAIHVRRQRLKISYEPKRQRCLSDSEAPSFQFPVDEDELKSEFSALGCDSDERNSRFQDSAYFSSPRVSLDWHSLEDNTEGHPRSRRVTPNPQMEPFATDGSQSDDQSSVPTSSNPGTMVHPRERSRRSLLKHFSQGSIGGGSIGGASSLGASSESPSLSSLLETQSNLTCATDILSSLGFDDFDSPQLVPDRFIPKELEFLRPSSMKVAFIEQSVSPDTPRSPDSLTSGQSSNAPVQQRSMELSDLPLGATAENFYPRAGSPTAVATIEVDKPVTPASPADSTPLFTNTAAIPGFTRHRVLETVPEETASDLSLSPRWLSPRVSIDHSVSVLDFAEGKLLGTNLPKARRRSLPTREGYKLSIGSLVESDTGDSIHLSVTSYDDEIAAEREREREALMSGICDDMTMGPGRRRRRGVYTPPQTLLSWLSTQKTIDEEVDTDPDELPWPFNEEARLRKSLTEISIAQQLSLTEDDSVHDSTVALEDNAAEVSSQREVSLSPLSTPNGRLSPQPSLSDVDIEELTDLEVDCLLSPLQRHSGMISHDWVPRLSTVLSPDSTVLSPDTADAAVLSIDSENGSVLERSLDTEAAASLFPSPQQQYQHSGTSHLMPHVAPVRPRRAPICPLNTTRSSLPHLSEGFRTLRADDLKTPTTVESRFLNADELEPPNSNLGVPRLPASGLNPTNSLLSAPNSLLSEVSRPPLTPPSSGGSTLSDSTASTESYQQEKTGEDLTTIESPGRLDEQTVISATLSPLVSSKTCRSRGPRLGTLRQTSIDSSGSLPEDMSEIELLTGDLHSPAQKSKVPLKRQENLEDMPARPKVSRCRPSRRVAVIGDAPVAAELSEVEKYMVL